MWGKALAYEIICGIGRDRQRTFRRQVLLEIPERRATGLELSRVRVVRE